MSWAHVPEGCMSAACESGEAAEWCEADDLSVEAEVSC